jgi:hypothetical protein
VVGRFGVFFHPMVCVTDPPQFGRLDRDRGRESAKSSYLIACTRLLARTAALPASSDISSSR